MRVDPLSCMSPNSRNLIGPAPEPEQATGDVPGRATAILRNTSQVESF